MTLAFHQTGNSTPPPTSPPPEIAHLTLNKRPAEDRRPFTRKEQQAWPSSTQDTPRKNTRSRAQSTQPTARRAPVKANKTAEPKMDSSTTSLASVAGGANVRSSVRDPAFMFPRRDDALGARRGEGDHRNARAGPQLYRTPTSPRTGASRILQAQHTLSGRTSAVAACDVTETPNFVTDTRRP